MDTIMIMGRDVYKRQRFTGAVPSGDSRTGGTSSDKTMNAVSIELSDGRTVTLMPLSLIHI